MKRKILFAAIALTACATVPASKKGVVTLYAQREKRGAVSAWSREPGRTLTLTRFAAQAASSSPQP